VLQLSAPSDFGRNVLLPWLDEFQARHPQLQLRLLLGDGLTDLFRQPVDLVLRYGEPQDSSLVALPVAAGNRRVLCASPAYLQRHGAPQRLDELAGHNCLRFMLAGRVHDRWCFQEGRRARTVQVSGDRVRGMMPMWCDAGPWPASGWRTSRGWTSPMTWRPVACGCCCRSASAKRRHWACSAPTGPS